MTTPPTPLEEINRERVILALVRHLADDHLETITLDVELAVWLIVSLSDEQLRQLAHHVLKGLHG